MLIIYGQGQSLAMFPTGKGHSEQPLGGQDPTYRGPGALTLC